MAIDLGIALQLTNIVADRGSDLQRGRLYIPIEDLRKFGCTETGSRAIVTGNVAALLAFECERARQYYRKAERRCQTADARGLVAARIMAAIYADLLRAIEQSNYDVLGRRHSREPAAEAMIAAFTCQNPISPKMNSSSPMSSVVGAGVGRPNAAVAWRARRARSACSEAKAVLRGRASSFNESRKQAAGWITPARAARCYRTRSSGLLNTIGYDWIA